MTDIFFWEQDGEMKTSSKRTADEYLKDFFENKDKPLFNYPVSSVEQNMVLCALEEALDLSKKLNETDKKVMRNIYKQRLAKS